MGGMADFSKYNDGARGGKVRIRAKISQLDKNTLIITDLPFGTTTGSLIDTILAANDKEKIKIRKIEDNTSDKVEILVHLPVGISHAVARLPRLLTGRRRASCDLQVNQVSDLIISLSLL